MIKKVIFLILIIFALGAAGFYFFGGDFNFYALFERFAEKNPKIEISPPSYDFGRVKYGEVSSYLFEIKNIGGLPLEISEISTSCSCTQAFLDNRVITPGGTENMKVTFNPAIHKDDTDLGKIKRTVYLKTNDPQNPEPFISISADVYKEIKP